MHSMGIIHRDLKPENILCVYPKSIAKIKISDFGISKIIKVGQTMKTICGTLSYSAPEILKGKGYDKSVDYWSLGVIFYMLLDGYPPFVGDNDSQVKYSILNYDPEFDGPNWNPKIVSKGLKILIQGLLHKNPKRRRNIEDILNLTKMDDFRFQIKFTIATKKRLTKTFAKRKSQRHTTVGTSSNWMSTLSNFMHGNRYVVI